MIKLSILIDGQEIQTVNADSLEKSLNLYLKQLSRQKDRIEELCNTKESLDDLTEAMDFIKSEELQIIKLRNAARKARIESQLRKIVDIVEE